MTFCCKGICDTLEIDTVSTALRYRLGQKRCTMCSIFVKTSNLGCPCCGARLRTKSRSKRSRKKSILNIVN